MSVVTHSETCKYCPELQQESLWDLWGLTEEVPLELCRGGFWGTGQKGHSRRTIPRVKVNCKASQIDSKSGNNVGSLSQEESQATQEEAEQKDQVAPVQKWLVRQENVLKRFHEPIAPLDCPGSQRVQAGITKHPRLDGLYTTEKNHSQFWRNRAEAWH